MNDRKRMKVKALLFMLCKNAKAQTRINCIERMFFKATGKTIEESFNERTNKINEDNATFYLLIEELEKEHIGCGINLATKEIHFSTPKEKAAGEAIIKRIKGTGE